MHEILKENQRWSIHYSLFLSQSLIYSALDAHLLFSIPPALLYLVMIIRSQTLFLNVARSLQVREITLYLFIKSLNLCLPYYHFFQCYSLSVLMIGWSKGFQAIVPLYLLTEIFYEWNWLRVKTSKPILAHTILCNPNRGCLAMNKLSCFFFSCWTF